MSWHLAYADLVLHQDRTTYMPVQEYPLFDRIASIYTDILVHVYM